MLHIIHAIHIVTLLEYKKSPHQTDSRDLQIVNERALSCFLMLTLFYVIKKHSSKELVSFFKAKIFWNKI